MILTSALIWPTAVLFTPLAGAIATTTPGSLAKEVAFLAMLVSLALDEVKADEHEWLIARLSPNHELLASYARRLLLGVGVACMSMAPAATLGAGVGLQTFLVMMLAAAHLSAVYSLAKALGLKASLRSVLVSFIALAIPATNLGEGKLAQIAQAVLDPRASQYSAQEPWALTLVQIISIFTLMFASAGFSRALLHKGRPR